MSSPAFHYPNSDRRAAIDPNAPTPLPAKIGSFQLFLDGFKGADDWLRDHPLPQDNFLKGDSTQNLNNWNCLSDTEDIGERAGGSGNFRWTRELLCQFKEELQKLVILDYLIRNTGTLALLAPSLEY